MLGVGIYLIYQGEVINKYHQKLTRRNYHDQALTEFPSVVTFLRSYEQYYEFERDYQIHFIEGTHQSLENATKLSYGNDSLHESTFDVQVTNYRNYTGVAITLINFSSALPSEYSLIYSAKNDTITQHYVMADIRTTKGILSCHGKYHDGEDWGMYLRFGELGTLSITKTVKKVHLEGTKKCRIRSYTEEFNEIFLHNMRETCERPCKHQDYFERCWGLTSSEDSGFRT